MVIPVSDPDPGSSASSTGAVSTELKLADVDQVLVDQPDRSELDTGFLTAAPPDPVAVYLASLGSVESRRTMTGTLDRLACLLTGRAGTTASEIPWHLLRSQHTTAIRAQLLAAYAPSTARKMLSGLAGVLKQCWRLQLMSRDDYDRTIDWGTVNGTTLSGAGAGRHVEAGELVALFGSCAADPRPTGARDAAMFAILFGAGLRRAETVTLDVADYNRSNGQLVVAGKGDRTRIAYCGTGARAALEVWLQVRGDEPGPLLVAVNKAGRIDPDLQRLSTSGLYGIVQRRAAAAGIAHFSPHDGRRTFAGELFDANADLAAVQQLMGHARASTTTGYDRRPAAAKARAASLIHVPYVARHSPADDGLD
jgi:integrase